MGFAALTALISAWPQHPIALILAFTFVSQTLSYVAWSMAAIQSEATHNLGCQIVLVRYLIEDHARLAAVLGTEETPHREQYSQDIWESAVARMRGRTAIEPHPRPRRAAAAYAAQQLAGDIAAGVAASWAAALLFPT